MTKLIQWLLLSGVFGIFYMAALLDFLPVQFSDEKKFFILISPVLLLALFGFVSVVIIMYRVATFNDCIEAAKELKRECEEAKKDLMSKGIKFD
ncbi:dolichol-phosphate mannosyltransferase subunit 3 isoform X2 [Hydra vulgaris]|uniref:Dolichol-phosphate mannosyltransferase subunit 3 n=1 Tax=Hydra vulgaris TaxID=6087 RepID=A0ABM4CZ35_HYDVU